MGISYKSYCVSLTRTLLINPLEEQKEAYMYCLRAHTAMLKLLEKRPDANSKPSESVVTFANLYHVAKNTFPPHLQSRFGNSAGFLMGLEFRDALCMVNPKNDKPIQENMMLCFSIGLNPEAAPESSCSEAPEGGGRKKWAIWITDTVLVKVGLSLILSLIHFFIIVQTNK